MAEANVRKGDGCVAEAEKALAKSGGFGSIFGFTNNKKFEEAADAYNRAGNFYKLANDFVKAGAAYMHAAENFERAGDAKTEALNAMVESATCYKKGGDLRRSVKLFERAIELYSDGGRLGMAARYMKEVAEIFEADRNFPLAIEKYRAAAQLFEHDNKKSNANQCLQKAATFLSESGDAEQLRQAAKIYEDIAREQLTARLSSYSAKNTFFLALICFIALGDPIAVNQKLDQYSNEDSSFASCREADFVRKLSQAVEEYSLENYEGACAAFDQITPLDAWKIKLLLQGKQPLMDAVGGGAAEQAELDAMLA